MSTKDLKNLFSFGVSILVVALIIESVIFITNKDASSQKESTSVVSSTLTETTKDESLSNVEVPSTTINETLSYIVINPTPCTVSSVPVTEPESTVDEDYYYYLTEDEKYELATLVFLESGIESYECQKAVASVVLNRMTAWGMTLHDVIYQKSQFTPAYLIPETSPSNSCIEAVNDVVKNGNVFPENVLYFRANHYFDWPEDRYTKYTNIDHTYFTADQNY